MWPAAHNALVACILLALFIGSVVHEVIALDPRRRVLAVLAGVLTSVLILVLLVLLLR